MLKTIHYFLIFIIIIVANTVNAANIVVTTNADSGPGSLRLAILNAKSGDKIIFNLSAGNEIIIILSQLPIVTKDITIDGSNLAGSGIPITVQVINPGSSPFRVFYIADTTVTDTIENITIMGGDISSLKAKASFGGGILVDTSATIFLINSKVIGSIAASGGGIYNYGKLNIISSTIRDDSALYLGGGIFNNAFNLNINSTTITRNKATKGGGIYNSGINMDIMINAELTITSSTISENNSEGIYNMYGDIILNSSLVCCNGGGGIFNDGGHDLGGSSLIINSSAINENRSGGILNYGGWGGDVASVTISSSTINGNQGGGISNWGGGDGSGAYVSIFSSTISKNISGSGGGIYNEGEDAWAIMTITSSTISENQATDSWGEGGGIYNNGLDGTATITICSSTICNNKSNAQGGGIFNTDYIATIYLLNSIIINNTSPAGDDISNTYGNYTLIYANYCWFNKSWGTINSQLLAPNDTINYSYNNLDSLKLNSPGTTATMATNPGCPAIGKGTFVYYNSTDGYYFVDNNSVSHKLINWSVSPVVNPADKITTDQRGVTRSSPPTIGAYQEKYVGITEYKNNPQFLIYPNPATNSVTLERVGNKKLGSEIYVLTLRNLEGQEVLTATIEFTETYKLDLTNLTNGLYFLSLQNDAINYVRKVVKQ